MSTKLDVLLIEDNSEDIQMTRETLAGNEHIGKLTIIQDGETAIERLRAMRRPHVPDLILLDLYLPKRTGLEVLLEVKGMPELASVPVVILTASTANEDFIERFNIRASACLQKPIDPTAFERVAGTIAA
ncbi:MAG TPA: response regulator [Candidatus Eisenbacteria bacterium]|jgi:CheY-like chemotaxis protein|nr:response regulator [Candidatus Eisenbacteria bacterium]